MNIDDYLRKSLGGTKLVKASATPYTGKVVAMLVCDLPSATVTFDSDGVTFTDQELPTGFVPGYVDNVSTAAGNVILYTV